jgi:hypothetical protein
MLRRRDQMASCMTLVLETAAARARDVSFVHCLPGLVKGGIDRERDSDSNTMMTVIMGKILMPFLQTPVEEAGERHLYLMTSARYPAAVASEKKGNGKADGVPVGDGVEVVKGCNGVVGSGVYSIGWTQDSSPAKIEKFLKGFREDGTRDKVWEYVVGDFERITGVEAMV